MSAAAIPRDPHNLEHPVGNFLRNGQFKCDILIISRVESRVASLSKDSGNKRHCHSDVETGKMGLV